MWTYWVLIKPVWANPCGDKSKALLFTSSIGGAVVAVVFFRVCTLSVVRRIHVSPAKHLKSENMYTDRCGGNEGVSSQQHRAERGYRVDPHGN